MTVELRRGAAASGLALAVVSAAAFGLSGPFAKGLIDAGWSANGAVLVPLGGAAVVLALVLAVLQPGVLTSATGQAPQRLRSCSPGWAWRSLSRS